VPIETDNPGCIFEWSGCWRSGAMTNQNKCRGPQRTAYQGALTGTQRQTIILLEVAATVR
jgi:hypothetical protein